MESTSEELLKENKSLKRKIKLLEQSVNQAQIIRENYDSLIKKLEERDNRLEEMNNKLEILVQQRTSELEQINEQLKSLTITDALTNLNNRRAFDDIFSREFNRSRRQDYNFNFFVLDVDNFKKYNDHYGHHRGDDVLAEIGYVLNKYSRRADDFAFRYGGEEFAFITSYHDEEELFKIADAIRKAIYNKKMRHDKNESYEYVTVSIGAVVSINEVKTMDEVFEKADENLYKAKEEGRNRVVISTI